MAVIKILAVILWFPKIGIDTFYESQRVCVCVFFHLLLQLIVTQFQIS